MSSPGLLSRQACVDWPADELARVTIDGEGDIRRAANALAAIAQRLGFKVSATSDISSRRWLTDSDGRSLNREVFGWENEQGPWWEEASAALYSPVALACRYESEPFWINAKGAHCLADNNYLEQIRFGEYLEDEVHASSAIVVPAHLPFGQIAVACFAPCNAEEYDLSARFGTHGYFLSSITHRFMRSYVAAGRNHYCVPANCKLTKRQVQCLHWAAMGKTDLETSLILSISHAAVRHHIKLAVDKLDCVNRSQAIFKASQLGFIGALDKSVTVANAPPADANRPDTVLEPGA